MFCTKCGKPIADDDRFCSACGNVVDTSSEKTRVESSSTDEKNEAKEIVQEKKFSPAQSNSFEEEIENKSSENNSVRTIRKVSAIVVSVFTLIAVLYMLTSAAARLVYSLSGNTLLFWLPTMALVAYVCMVFFKVKFAIIAIVLALILSFFAPLLDPSVILVIGCVVGLVLEIIAVVKDLKEKE